MKALTIASAVIGLAIFGGSPPGRAQSDLPAVNVTAPYTRSHGGYLISGDFKVDLHMPTVVFPAQALVKDDILSVRPVHMNDDEYLVLQECATADCHKAHLVRVWNAGGALGTVQNSDARVWIQHENKYFIWMERLPEVARPDCTGCNTRFTSFEPFSPPMTLVPVGDLASFHRKELVRSTPVPVPVASQAHEGSTFVVTFVGGATVRIQRMHAVR